MIEKDLGLQSVKNKRVIVTGGTHGVGLATARFFAERGAKVFIFGRHQDKLDAAMTELKKVSSDIYGGLADLTNEHQVSEIFRQAEVELGGLDFLINNAGLPAGNIQESEYDEWQYVINTMLLGYMICAKKALALMKNTGSGHIVNIGSLSAEVFDWNSDVYVAAKSGVRGFNNALRKKVAKDNIKVSLIEPGQISTTLHQISEQEARKMEQEGLGLSVDDIARLIYFIIAQPLFSDITWCQIRPHFQSEL